MEQNKERQNHKTLSTSASLYHIIASTASGNEHFCVKSESPFIEDVLKNNILFLYPAKN